MGEAVPERRINDVADRLARIEAGQMATTVQLEANKDQLDRVITLLDRMVRVEERLEGVLEDYRGLEGKVSAVEQDLASWRTARAIFTWVTGLMGALGVGALLLLLEGGTK